MSSARRVHSLVEGRVVEIGVVEVVLAVVDRRPVVQEDPVPRVVVVGAPARADAKVERLAANAHAVVDLAAGPCDPVHLEADGLEVLLDDVVLREIDCAVVPVVNGDGPQRVSRMPAGEVARPLQVRMRGIDVDVLVAGRARREVLIERCRKVAAGSLPVGSAVDGVVHRQAHVQVRKEGTLRVQRHVADAIHRVGEPLLEPVSCGRAVRPVLIDDVVATASGGVVEVPGDDLVDQNVLVQVEVVLQRAESLRPRPVVVRISKCREVLVDRVRRDVIGPCRGNRSELLDRRQRCRHRAGERHREQCEELALRVDQVNRQRVALGDDPGDLRGLSVVVRDLADDVPEELARWGRHLVAQRALEGVLHALRCYHAARRRRECEVVPDLERVREPVLRDRRHRSRDLGPQS